MKKIILLSLFLLSSCDNPNSGTPLPATNTGSGLASALAGGMAAGVGAGIGHAAVGHAINRWQQRKSPAVRMGGFNRMSRGFGGRR